MKEYDNVHNNNKKGITLSNRFWENNNSITNTNTTEVELQPLHHQQQQQQQMMMINDTTTSNEHYFRDGIMKIDYNNNDNNNNDDSNHSTDSLNNDGVGKEYEVFYIGNSNDSYKIYKSQEDIIEIEYDEKSSWTWWMSSEWEEYFFPYKTPIECQLLRRENIGVPVCYLLVGLLQGLSGVVVNVLPLDLNATQAQQTTVSSIRGLPSSFKLLFGFWSDTVPIFGYRRKPYMFIGWLVASISMLCLHMFSNLNIPSRNAGCFKAEVTVQNDDDDYIEQHQQQQDEERIIPEDAPTIPFLSICLLIFGLGFWLADVMGDSIVAEKAKLEPIDQRGSIQSTCYACRFFGKMIAAPASTAFYSWYGPDSIIILLSILPMCILPFVYLLHEVPNSNIPTVKIQCNEIWNTVCSRAVWQPLAFVYIYNIMQVGNSAWKEYLVTIHHFTSCQLNMLLVTSYALLYVGIIVYKNYLRDWSWRHIYISTTLLTGIFSIGQILLIYGITFGLSPFLFTLGDDALMEFVDGIQFLPTTIMMVHLCPQGSEGASYAMFTTVNNSALSLSSAISTQLLKIWDVSRTALQNGQLQGMVNLTIFKTICQTSAIIFVGLLPRYKEDLIRLGQSKKSPLGGFIFLFIIFAGITYAITIGVLNIAYPGWMGES